MNRSIAGTFSLRIWKKPWVVLFLFASTVLVCVAGYISHRSITQGLQERFDFASLEVQALIEQRLNTYAQVLRGGVGVFYGGNEVTRQEWKSYSDALEIQKHFPGIQGVGFSVFIPQSDLKKHEAQIRGEGFPGYAVRPAGNRAEYHSIIFLEPFRDRNLRAFGFDMYSEDARREAMQRARDEDRLAMSGPVRLVQETDKKIQSGFLMYLPVYKKGFNPKTLEERRRSLLGFVYAPFRTQDFMEGILFRNLQGVAFEVFDVDSSGKSISMYRSNDDHEPDLKGELTSTFKLEHAGRTWHIRTYSLPEFFKHSDQWLPWSIISVGVFINLLLLVVIEVLLDRKHRVEELARTLTVSLKEKTERLELAVEGSQDGIWDWDLASGTLFLSRRWKDMLGYSESDIEDSFESWVQLLHPQDHESVMGQLNAFLEGCSNEYSLVHRLRKKDGSYAWIHAKGVAQRDEANRVLRMAGSHKDITDHKYYESLLIEAKDQALSTAKAKSEFLATISHEIRTPLNGIVGMADLLRQSSLNDLQEESVEAIVSASRHLRRILDDVLSFSKFEAGVFQLEESATSLPIVVAGVQREFAPFAERRGIEFVVESTVPDGVLYLLDEVRLRQILFNLVENAIKFTEHGSVYLKISRRCLEREKEELVFEVADTGVGIPEDLVTQVFDPFVQVDGSKTRQFGDAGLGLAICKKLVDAMSGEIGVESERGVGSRFFFRVPVKKAPQGMRPSESGREFESPMVVRSLNVLVADDNPMNQKVIVRQLQTLGIKAAVAADGMAAYDMISKKDFDLVLMDCHMPVLDGVAATRMIRALKGPMSTVPILGVTADILSDARQECIQAGMNGVLTKPYEIAELAKTVGELIGTSGLASHDNRLDEAVLDRLRLLNAPGEKDFAEELVEDFIRAFPAQISKFEQAYKAGDLELLLFYAHSFKSSAATIGARTIVELLRVLEDRVRMGSCDDLAMLIEEVSQRCASLAFHRQDFRPDDLVDVRNS